MTTPKTKDKKPAGKKKSVPRLCKWALVRTDVLQSLLGNDKWNKKLPAPAAAPATSLPPGRIPDRVPPLTKGRRHHHHHHHHRASRVSRPERAMPGRAAPRPGISRSTGGRAQTEALVRDMEGLLEGIPGGHRAHAPRSGQQQQQRQQREAERTRVLYTQRLQKLLALNDSRRRRRRRKQLRKIGRVRPVETGEEDYDGDYDEEEEEEEYDDDYDYNGRAEDDRESGWWKGPPRRQLEFGEDGDYEDLSPLEREAAAVLPKTVKSRAMKLLQWLSDRGHLAWRPHSLELVVKGVAHPGTNIIDLAGHAVRDKGAKAPMRGSPGPPPGFEIFARLIRQTNAPRELVKNQHRWDMVHPVAGDESYDELRDTEAEDAFKTPPHSGTSPFMQWESSVWAEGGRR